MLAMLRFSKNTKETRTATTGPSSMKMTACVRSCEGCSFARILFEVCLSWKDSTKLRESNPQSRPSCPHPVPNEGGSAFRGCRHHPFAETTWQWQRRLAGRVFVLRSEKSCSRAQGTLPRLQSYLPGLSNRRTARNGHGL